MNSKRIINTTTETQDQCDIFTDRLYKYCNIKGKGLKKFLYKRKLKKFCKNILKSSPSFETLWDMALFIKNAEKLFFYINNPNKMSDTIGLYSSRNFPNNQNGFKLSTTYCQIILKLYIELNNDKRLVLEIENKDSGMRSNFVFINNEWIKDHSKLDEFFLNNVIGLINTHIINLFSFCLEKL